MSFNNQDAEQEVHIRIKYEIEFFDWKSDDRYKNYFISQN